MSPFPTVDEVWRELQLDESDISEMGLETLTDDSYVPAGVFTYPTIDEQPLCKAWTSNVPYFSDDDRVPFSLLDCAVDLAKHRWIRCTYRVHKNEPQYVDIRVYLLPNDVGRRDILRENPQLIRKLQILLNLLVTSSGAWQGDGPINPSQSQLGLKTKAAEADSLFYIFNTIESPTPEATRFHDEYDQHAALRILNGERNGLLGFKTELYPHQRRSIVTMMEREVLPRQSIDPRLQMVTGPVGNIYYYDQPAFRIFKDPPMYEDPRGGILAETMGIGKTYMVLGLLLATRHHMPDIPVDAEMTETARGENGTRSLMVTTADAILKSNVKWKQYFDLQEDYYGKSLSRCRALCNRPYIYHQVHQPDIATRSGPQIHELLLCKTTVVVVPKNLFTQWQSEIDRHIDKSKLDIMIVTDEFRMPDKFEASKRDMILIEKDRFSLEIGARAPRETEITGERIYPMRDMHFLRLVVDEGHSFASSALSSGSMNPLNLLRADRRWIVTGTPTNQLTGVDLHVTTTTERRVITSLQRVGGQPVLSQETQEILARRKQRLESDNADLKRLGRIVAELLKTQPWANTTHTGDKANWALYTKLGRVVDGPGRAATSVRAVMESLIVRHKYSDIEVALPPLKRRYVYLEPTLFDKYTMDLFTLHLASNSITSERTDQDYIFEPTNRKLLDRLIRNLRHSSFFWLGFSHKDATKALELLMEYKEEHPDMSTADKILTENAAKAVPRIIKDNIWSSLRLLKQMGYAVQKLPYEIACGIGIDSNSKAQAIAEPEDKNEDSINFTALPGSSIVAAQVFVDGRVSLGQPDPIRELTDNDALSQIVSAEDQTRSLLSESKGSEDLGDKRIGDRIGIPTSGFVEAGQLQLKPKNAKFRKSFNSLRSLGKKRKARVDGQEAISARDIRLIGTVSAKLSYLLSRIVELYKEEKILVFYEGDDIAWFIAQGLEILGIPHFIYANGISTRMRNQWLEDFSRDNSAERVMLIDLKQGGQGLNIVAASRVFFVNPVWSASQEAQAFKRAHRIGQQRPVFVETLVLRGGFEEQMVARRDALSAEESAKVADNLLLDEKVHDILKDFRFCTTDADADADANANADPNVDATDDNKGKKPEGDSNGNGDKPDADDEMRHFALIDIDDKPLLFAKADEYLMKTVIKQEPANDDDDDNGHVVNDTVVEPSGAVEPAKKVARFD